MGTARWRKSRHSFSNGNCVEVTSWRTAAASAGNGACVEAGQAPGVIAVRDTKDRGAGPVLQFTPEQWDRFTQETAEAESDHRVQICEPCKGSGLRRVPHQGVLDCPVCDGTGQVEMGHHAFR